MVALEPVMVGWAWQNGVVYIMVSQKAEQSPRWLSMRSSSKARLTATVSFPLQDVVKPKMGQKEKRELVE